MKNTFSNKIYNWTLIFITFAFAIYQLYCLFSRFPFVSNYFDAVFNLALASIALYSLGNLKVAGEKYSFLFIIGYLILFPISYYIQYFSRIIKYDFSTVEFSFPIIHLIFAAGALLLYFGIKFSKKTITERIDNFGFTSIIIGIYLIIQRFINIFDFGFNYSIVKFVFIILIPCTIIFIGNKLKTNSMKANNGIVLNLFLLILFYFLIYY
ncbi:hypothetical protein KSK37_08085 [Kaistella sp. DKR-2]|nr:hypothetical protein [Kaistella soli]